MKFNSNKITIFTIAAVMVLFIGISFFACENFVPNNAATALVNQPNEALSGGATTVFDQSVNAFALPVPTLSSQDELLFFVGNSFFNVLDVILKMVGDNRLRVLGNYLKDFYCD